MILEIKSIFAGIICGIVFNLLLLPIPAPTVFAGIAGIIGIYIGFNIIQLIR